MRLIPNRFLLALTMAVALLTSFLLGSCADRNKVSIGVSQCSYDDWRLKLNDEMYRESLLYDDLELEIRSAYDDPDRQVEDIRHFIDKGVNVIIASPQNSENLNEILAEARSKGIKVIDFDRKASKKCYDIFVGADNVMLGKGAGDYLTSHVGAGMRYIEIEGLGSSTPAGERHAGFTQAVAASPDAVCVARACGAWDQKRAERVADSLLRLHPDVNAIFAHNDRMAIGAREAARKLKIDSLTIVGIDAVPQTGIQAVADGRLDATFMYPTAGKELIDLGMRAARGARLSDEFIISSALPVDRSNAGILLELSESLDDEKNKVGFLKNRVDDYASRHHAQGIILISIIIIACLLALVAFFVMRAYWQRKRSQAQLAERNARLQEQRDELESLNTQLRDATQSKLRFFTNVSHDLRTPLTLIAEPIAVLSRAANLTPDQRTLVTLADKNILILRRLINQILDFRKFENGKLTLDLREMHLPGAFAEWADSFRTLARRRHIAYGVEFGPFATESLALDPEKMERIFFNLMSNAFKFTPDNGRIRVNVSVEDEKFILTIGDSGKGIAADDLAKVFDRFYQADRVTPEGSGIGLALVKAFVELHSGSVAVESQPGQGSVFRVEIPVRHVDAAEGTPESAVEASAPIAEPGEGVDRELARVEDPRDGEIDESKPCLLVIDDTADIRTLLRSILGDEYTIIEAADGKQGIRLASRFIPDLIICDMMMPEMDGMECCRRLKGETSTSHIPVLMLTACRLDEQRADAYEAGADGYVSKPFSTDVLRARCRSLIANRRLLEKKDILAPADPKSETPAGDRSVSEASAKVKKAGARDPMAIENDFYRRFMEIVDAELGNPEITVEEIGARLGLSRVQFYRKIKALTNFSPNEIIRIRRLKEAYAMLTSGDRTVSEVAYAVGFSSPGYFTKCFREQFGELPADLQKRTARIR